MPLSAADKGTVAGRRGTFLRTKDGSVVFVKGLSVGSRTQAGKPVLSRPAAVVSKVEEDTAEDPAAADDDEESETAAPLPHTANVTQALGRLRGEDSVLCGTANCMKMVGVNAFGEHCNTEHGGVALKGVYYYNKDLERQSLTQLGPSFVCSHPGCRHLFVSTAPIRKSVVNAHWEARHPGSSTPFHHRLRVLKHKQVGRRSADLLETAVQASLGPTPGPTLGPVASVLLPKTKGTAWSSRSNMAASPLRPPPYLQNTGLKKKLLQYPGVSEHILRNLVDFFESFVDQRTKARLDYVVITPLGLPLSFGNSL